ncbi:hypothetical protein JM83_1880 [Gillisia sp. Hel_I_86]|uniref:hypothetical protein n=1 Tax=Gillisia sp. Hel_I_86 TaxID=1249981 RepID=UPI00119BD9DF|nr:hypothetical protein [Gillisia sp. Hel_I_86]TVZ26884.1 hypothetical protein JM83_1880 [Gillisia sp. Hel_I_86]
MKTIKNLNKSILMVALMTASLSYASNTSTLMGMKDIKITALILEHVKEGELISIKDNSGLILYKEIVQNSGTYSKEFDLTALPDGNYFFEIDGDVKIKTIPFIVRAKNVVFDKTKETIFIKPTTRLKGNLILVSKLALDLEPLKIDVYYKGISESYELLNSETIDNTKVIERIYKLSDAYKGNYKIVYHSSGKEFTEFIDF